MDALFLIVLIAFGAASVAPVALCARLGAGPARPVPPVARADAATTGAR